MALFISQEGMFNNANVIFRTKFVDGVSTVSRTLGSGANTRPRGALLSQENDSSNERAKKRRGRGDLSGKENTTIEVEA
jgi:structural maintenance of chromosome 2